METNLIKDGMEVGTTDKENLDKAIERRRKTLGYQMAEAKKRESIADKRLNELWKEYKDKIADLEKALKAAEAEHNKVAAPYRKAKEAAGESYSHMEFKLSHVESSVSYAQTGLMSLEGFEGWYKKANGGSSSGLLEVAEGLELDNGLVIWRNRGDKWNDPRMFIFRGEKLVGLWWAHYSQHPGDYDGSRMFWLGVKNLEHKNIIPTWKLRGYKNQKSYDDSRRCKQKSVSWYGTSDPDAKIVEVKDYLRKLTRKQISTLRAIDLNNEDNQEYIFKG